MRPSTSLFGASRLPLTTKRAGKDFYKGTGQSYAPGGGHRTGPPGKHVVRGKGKYRLLDERVRYFVGPGNEALGAASSSGVCPPSSVTPQEGKADMCPASQLKPYVSTLVPHAPSPQAVPSFSPTLPKAGLTVPSPSTPSGERTLRTAQQYSRWYWSRSEDERQWDIQQARRRWWGGMSEHLSEKRGDRTKEVEQQAEQAQAAAAAEAKPAN